MNKRIIFVYLFIVFIFLISLPFTKIKISNPFHITLPVEEEIYLCYNAVIPDGVQVLFFSNIDGTLNFDKYTRQYYFTEYELAPKIVAAIQDGPVDIEKYQWFIGYDVPAEDLDVFVKKAQLQVIQKCDPGIVMKRIQ